MAEAPLLTHVEFRSDLFPPYEGEEEETNPGRHGKRLAEFLVAALRKDGFTCKEPAPTDWGWRIDIENDAFPLWVGCGVYEEYPDGFLCFIDPTEPTIRRFFKKIETREPVEAVQRAMDKALASDPGIREVRWWTHEDFNGVK